MNPTFVDVTEELYPIAQLPKSPDTVRLCPKQHELSPLTVFEVPKHTELSPLAVFEVPTLVSLISLLLEPSMLSSTPLEA